MNKHVQPLPTVAVLPLAHLTMRIYATPGGGLSWGMVPTDALPGAAVEMCGFAERGMAGELRRIADVIEAKA